MKEKGKKNRGFLHRLFNRSNEAERAFEAGGSSFTLPRLPTIDYINEDLKSSIYNVRSTARELEKNTDITSRYLMLNQMNVIGPNGIRLQMQIKDKAGNLLTDLNREIEEQWDRWCKRGSCDTTGKWSFIDIQYFAIRSLLLDGECIIRHIPGWKHNESRYAMQPIDAWRLNEMINDNNPKKNRVVMGIEIDEWDRPLRYNFRPKVVMGEPIAVEAKYITHIHLPQYVDAVRGVSALSPVANRMRMIKGWDEAMLVKARAEAARMGFYKKTQFDAQNLSGDEDAKGEFLEKLEPGQFSIVPPGWEITPYENQTPGQNTIEYRTAQLRSIAAGLNVGYNDLAGDYSGVNYTSLRAAALTDREIYRSLQNHLIRTLCTDTYQNWFSCAYLAGRFKEVNRSNYDLCLEPNFVGRAFQWVDPLKDGKAQLELYNQGVMSAAEIAVSRGREISDIYAEISEEQRMRKEYDIEILPGFVNQNPVDDSTSENDEESKDSPNDNSGIKIA